MKILIIEDETKVARFVADGLREEHFHVDVVDNGEEGLYRAREFPVDVILLDVRLPGIDGFTVLERLRGVGVTARILMLTARDEVSDRVRGLAGGADDYLVKPFAFEELLARVRALMRRSRELVTLSAGGLTLDPRQRRASRDGQPLKLTTREFDVLEFLLRHSGVVVSRTELAENVWDENFDSDSNVVDVTLYHLRKKLDHGYPARLVHTVRGVGYVLRATE